MQLLLNGEPGTEKMEYKHIQQVVLDMTGQYFSNLEEQFPLFDLL